MKMIFKKSLAFFLSMLLLCSLGAVAFADSTVTYATDHKFYVTADTDLFDGFKNIMPGDTRTETITVRNQCYSSQYIYIYMQALPHDPTAGPHVSSVAANESYATMMDFLSQISLTVTLNGAPISQDTADKSAGLASRQLIGVFKAPGQSTVQATVSVPITMGNEYAQRMGEIDWVFTAEEWGEPVNLRTGDDSNMTLWLLFILISMAALTWIFIVIRRKKKSS